MHAVMNSFQFGRVEGSLSVNAVNTAAAAFMMSANPASDVFQLLMVL
jgi:hypothetical protein